MDLDSYFEKTSNESLSMQTDLNPNFKSGFVALVGRPNSGKSTLVNKVVGTKVAITSNVSQTTRKRMHGVLTTADFQLVLTDTPGIHKPKDVLGEELNKSALTSIQDVDAIAMVIDSSKPIGNGDRWVASSLSKCKAPLICVLSKKDLVCDEELSKQIESASSLRNWDALVCLSAKTGYNIDAFVEECVSFLPKGPLWFDRDVSSDITFEQLVAEVVREKALRTFSDEIPHSIGVICESLYFDSKKNIYRIEATVYTERDSQKAMIIGKEGRSIKKIGSLARQTLEEAFGAKVYLGLSVKAKPGWRRDISQLEMFGYTV